MIRLLRQLASLGWLSPRTGRMALTASRKHGAGFGKWLHLSALRFPDHPALADETRRLNFSEQYEEVVRLSGYLLERWPGLGEKTVVLACANAVNDILLLYALQNLAIPLVLVHPHTPPHELQNLAENSERPVLVFSDDANNPGVLPQFSIRDLFNDCPAGADPRYSREHPGLIFPTSGTTGKPKLIRKRKGMLYWLRAFADLVTYTGIHRRKAVFISTPVTHGYGYTALLFALVLGKKAVVCNSRKSSDQASLLLREACDLLSGVPASLYRLATELQGQPHRLSLVISGGAPLSQPVIEAVASGLTTHLFSLYGSTEASTSFLARYEELRLNPQALGRPLRGIRYRLQALPGGGQELWVCSPLANKNPGDWLATGDLAVRDENGLLAWCGRKDDMLIKNGVNIYPAEIEQALLRLPGVADALVWGEPDPVAGCRITACIVQSPGTESTDEFLRQELRKELPGVKVPDNWIRVEAISYTPTGKKRKPESLALTKNSA